MKYCGAKTVNERWAHFNAVRPSNATAGTYRYERQPEPELGQSDVALAPINKLPDDVFYHIFTLHCREQTDAVCLPFNHNNIAPQITISHVCSVWRDVILTIPSLWNDFAVFMDDAKDGDILINIVHDWLFRARGMPCSLTLDFKVEDSTLGTLKQERWYGSIVKCLISQFRFRKLSTPWSSNHWVQFLQLPAEKLSCIEDLHIRCINPPSLWDFDISPSQGPLNSFKKLTKLTSLRLDKSLRRAFRDVVYSKDSVFAYIPWHQLRHIRLSIPTSILFCFIILQESSMVLETFSIVIVPRASHWAEIRSSYAGSLYCPQLRTLELLVHLLPGYSRPFFDPILLWIRMPNLKALTVGSYDWTPKVLIFLSSLVGMQEISNMQLEELTLCNHDTCMEVGNVLEAFPLLKRIELSGNTCLSYDTINQLGSGLVAPCLEELVIQCDHVDLNKLLQMVKGRSSLGKCDVRQENEPTPFKYVKLKFYREEVPDEYQESLIEEINRCDVQLIVESNNLSY